jgi:hypothetical protein
VVSRVKHTESQTRVPLTVSRLQAQFCGSGCCRRWRRRIRGRKEENKKNKNKSEEVENTEKE